MATDLLAALIQAPAGWCDPAALGGVEEEWKALIESGDVQAGADPLTKVLMVALTPLGAERLGYHLEETSRLEVYWCGDAALVRPNLPPARAERALSNHSEALGRHADPRPDHRDLAGEADELRRAWDQVRRRRPRLQRELPLPTVLVGMSAPGYLPADEFDRHNPRAGKCGHDRAENLRRGRPCRYCTYPLSPRSECPRCGNWGLDGAFARLLAAELRARAAGSG